MLQVRAEAVRATVVSLMDCLLKSGMSCALAESLISPVSRGKPAHYISTLFQLGQDSQVTACLVELTSATEAKPFPATPKKQGLARHLPGLVSGLP